MAILNRDLVVAAKNATGDAECARRGLREQLALNTALNREIVSLRWIVTAQRLLLTEAREHLAAVHGGMLSAANKRLLRRIDSSLRPTTKKAAA